MANYWFDTDPGVDDALAILVALLEVGPEVAGFSTVFGNHPEEVSARNLARLLSRLSETGLTSPGWRPRLARGAKQPLAGEQLSSEGIHGSDGLSDVDWEPTSPWSEELGLVVPPGGEQVPANLSEATAGLPGLDLVCLGPLTNLALALDKDRGFVNRVTSLYIMGGSLRAGGNSSMAAEYNFLSDAAAAHQVLQAGFKEVRLVPLDAALTCRFQAHHWEKLENIKGNAALLARQILGAWETRIRQRGQGMYDLVAWLLVTHPEWAVWEEVFVDVDVAGGLAHGASLADWRNRSGNKPNLKAATTVNGTAMWDYFLEKLANADGK